MSSPKLPLQRHLNYFFPVRRALYTPAVVRRGLAKITRATPRASAATPVLASSGLSAAIVVGVLTAMAAITAASDSNAGGQAAVMTAAIPPRAARNLFPKC